jgi:hypothetical protein
MSPQRSAHRQYLCRFYGCELPARLRIPNRPDGAMLLDHLR